jgi:hypothetical protein
MLGLAKEMARLSFLNITVVTLSYVTVLPRFLEKYILDAGNKLRKCCARNAVKNEGIVIFFLIA